MYTLLSASVVAKSYAKLNDMEMSLLKQLCKYL